MQLKHYVAALCVMMAVVAVTPASARAQSTDLSAMLETLQSLMKQVETLQAQLAQLKGEIREEIKAGLAEGMEGDDIKKIQELLATDPTIYPRGIVSGYYGPLTTEAIKKFQERHGLTVTGVIDDETRELMKEYMKERQNGKFPPGLLTAPGIAKKVMDRLHSDDDGMYLKCDDKKAAGPLCKRKEDRSGKNMKGTSSTTVAVAVAAAEEAIAALEAALEDVPEDVDADVIADAEDDLEDAKDLLNDADEYYSKGDYRNASNKAAAAERLALRALDDLGMGDDSSSMDDDEDEDDDDDEDEDDDEDGEDEDDDEDE